METFVVIGLGRFGSAVAEELCALGHQVLAIDTDEKAVQRMADKVTQAVVGDCQDPEVLQMLGVKNMDGAVVAFSSDIGTSVLITLNLKELNIPRIVCKARNHSHREVLRRIGADQVVFPEQEMALRLARNLSNVDILNFIELSEDYSVVERRCPRQWLDKTIRDLDIRALYHLNVIAVRQGDGTMLIAPGGEYLLRDGDCMVVLGTNQDIERVDKL